MKDVKGFEGIYAVTSCGKVWSYKRNKFLKPTKSKKGYLSVKLQNDCEKKYASVHRLVAEAYIENVNNYDTVDHIDGNKENNNVNNLQWLPMFENLDRGKNARVKIRCIDTGKEYESIIDAARDINSCPSAMNGHINHNKPTSVKGHVFERI